MLFVLFCMMWLLAAGCVTAAPADVTATAKVTAGGSWKTTSKGIRYRLANGTYAKSSWRMIGGKLYRFDKNSCCVTGWFQYNKATYYANAKGQVYQEKWKKKKGSYYYLQKNGQMAANKMLKIKGEYYYFTEGGIRVTSAAVPVKNKFYYFNSSGVRVKSEWVPYQGKYYYFGPAGYMLFNQWVGDYYVGSDGARKTNCTVDGIELDENGRKKTAAGKYIFYGDSRMVEMKNSVSDKNIEYIAAVGAGYDWIQSTGDAMIKKSLSADPYIKVVLAFGVNDWGNIDKYISYYQTLIRNNPKTKFYVLAVNPVDEEKEALHGFVIKNEDLKEFNRKMKAAFSSCYLPSYGYLSGNFDSRDGVHYTEETYRKLYNYIMEKIK